MQKSKRVLLTLLALAGAAPLAATNHSVQIDEVMAGAFGRPELQFIEVKFPCGQNAWSPNFVKLAFFNASGTETGTFQFPTNPADDCVNFTNKSALIGTQAYKDLASAPDPDFIMPANLMTGSGKVCWKGLPSGFAVTMCLTYGNYTGDKEGAGASNAASPPLNQTCSLRRNTNFNFLGAPNLNADFALLAPAPTNNAGVTGSVVGTRFLDVSLSSPFLPFIEALAIAGVTSGCGNNSYCPGSAVTRDQMAVFLLRSKLGSSFVPPACTTPVFNDVPCSNPFSAWINELAARGITGGCGGGNYCPGNTVTRDQMAVFLLVTQEGSAFSPPACTTQAFNDVPCSNPFSPWINELAARGISGGCSAGMFCPGNPVTREQMSVFLSTTFGLSVPSSSCSP